MSYVNCFSKTNKPLASRVISASYFGHVIDNKLVTLPVLYWRPKVTRKFATLETEQYFEKFVIFMILTHMPMIVQALPLYFCTRKVWGIA